MIAAACAAAALPSPSVRLGAVSLLAAMALAVSPDSLPGRLAIVAATALSLHEGVWRGSFITGTVAVAGAVVLAGSSRQKLDAFDRAALVASALGTALTWALPNLELGVRLLGSLAWFACAAGLVAGRRLSPAVARSRWMAAPFALIAFASGYQGVSYAWARSQPHGVPPMQLAQASRKLGLRAFERQDLEQAALDAAVAPNRQVEAWLSAYRLGAGRGAWIERVTELRTLHRPEAGPEAHRLLLLESSEEFSSRYPDRSEAGLDPTDDFTGRLLMQAGKYAEAARLLRRWPLLEARALILDGHLAEARELLAPATSAELACARVDAGDMSVDNAKQCLAGHSFHRGAIGLLHENDRLAVLPRTDPVGAEFGGALRLIGARVAPKPGTLSVALLFEGMLKSIEPVHAVLEIHGPGSAIVEPPSVDLAPGPGDLVGVTFEVRTTAPGGYTVDLWLQSPWGPWMRTRNGRYDTDWPYQFGTVTVP